MNDVYPWIMISQLPFFMQSNSAKLYFSPPSSMKNTCEMLACVHSAFYTYVGDDSYDETECSLIAFIAEFPCCGRKDRRGKGTFYLRMD